MKKSLEAELMSLAEKILRMKNRADVHELKTATAALYEKLSVLSFAEKHFEGAQPSIRKKHVEDALAERMEKAPIRKAVHRENDENRYAPDGMQFNPEGITEPNTEKIKDIVANMPQESEELEPGDDFSPKKDEKGDIGGKGDFRDIGIHYDDLPQFEPVKNSPTQKNPENNTEKSDHAETNNRGGIEREPKNGQTEKDIAEKQTQPQEPKMPSFESKGKIGNKYIVQKKSLNQRLKKGISFGLNERLVYVKHLFGGNASDYDRVISQLNTFQGYDAAERFIESVVKPDYGHWKGEEHYEKRFLAALKNKLN